MIVEFVCINAEARKKLSAVIIFGQQAVDVGALNIAGRITGTLRLAVNTKHRSFGVGEWAAWSTEPIGDVVGEEFIVQFRATSEKLEGYFWRPDSPGNVTFVERQNLEGGEFAPRLAINGSDATYHEIWISTEPFPLPMPGTSSRFSSRRSPPRR